MRERERERGGGRERERERERRQYYLIVRPPAHNNGGEHSNNFNFYGDTDTRKLFSKGQSFKSKDGHCLYGEFVGAS